MFGKQKNEKIDQIEELNIKAQNDYNSYENDCKKLKIDLEKLISEFNQQISMVNNVSHDFRNQINELYEFLKEFGDIGTAITPFDFVTENAAIASEYMDEVIKAKTLTKNDATIGEWEEFLKVAKYSPVLIAPSLAIAANVSIDAGAETFKSCGKIIIGQLIYYAAPPLFYEVGNIIKKKNFQLIICLNRLQMREKELVNIY